MEEKVANLMNKLKGWRIKDFEQGATAALPHSANHNPHNPQTFLAFTTTRKTLYSCQQFLWVESLDFHWTKKLDDRFI